MIARHQAQAALDAITDVLAHDAGLCADCRSDLISVRDDLRFALSEPPNLEDVVRVVYAAGDRALGIGETAEEHVERLSRAIGGVGNG